MTETSLRAVQSGSGADEEDERRPGVVGRRRVKGSWMVHVRLQDALRNVVVAAARHVCDIAPSWQAMITLPATDDASAEQQEAECDFFGLEGGNNTVDPAPASSAEEESREEDLHISLSNAGAFLKIFQIDTFVHDMRAQLGHKKAIKISYGDIQQRQNAQNTTTFVCMDVVSGLKEIRSMLHCVDHVMAKYRLPAYHKEPAFHTSIACATDATGNAPALTDKQLEQLNSTFAHQLWPHTVSVYSVHCMVGNKSFEIPLNS
ncbi:poly(U)-specific 3'-to-5' RNA exonuclease [Sorochytrium milnesiophthora]